MYKVFPLNNSKELCEKIVTKKSKIGKIETKKFADGEIKVELLESVRGKNIILITSLTSSDDIIELMMAADAAIRASVKKIFALITYPSYMRQDRKDVPRTAIGAKVIARMIESTGIKEVITVDLHVSQIEGFFDIPVTHLEGRSFFYQHIKEKFNTEDSIIVSPDLGGAKRAKKFASKLGLPLAIINKEREMANEVASMELIGNVEGKNVIIVDDMVDTAGSLCKAADLLLENGANEVSACITHGIFSGPAKERIKNSKLKKLYVTDTIKLDIDDDRFKEKIEIVSCSDILSRALNIIKKKKSISMNID